MNNKVLVFALVLLTALYISTVINVINAQIEATPTIEIQGPVGGWQEVRPWRPWTIIAGRTSFTMKIYITWPKEAGTNLTWLEVWADAKGIPISNDTNATFQPYQRTLPTILIYDEHGNLITKKALSGEKFTSWLSISEEPFRTDVAYFNITAAMENVSCSIKPGWRVELTYVLSAPGENAIPQGKNDITIRLRFWIRFGSKNAGIQFIGYRDFRVIRPPIVRLYIVIGLAVGVFVGLQILGYLGFFKFYTDTDLITIALIGALQTVWVQIIGRQFVFPILDRIPFSYNFAVGDFPYILLLVIAIAIVRKPGAASLTLFVYNIISEIGWYGINPLWWAYPFAQGLPVDLYLLVRGRAIFTNKLSFFKVTIPEEEFVKIRELSGLRFIDGLIVGFLRGFFMQLSLYTVFFPTLFRIEYWWEYVFWWLVIPWAIGNSIEAAISVPIAERVEKAIVFA